MKKLIMITALAVSLFMAIALAVMLCGCKGQENATHIPVDKIEYACINGRLYIANRTTYNYIVYTPLFAADSDVPRLVQCNKVTIK